MGSPLILASGSTARQMLLKNAGLDFVAIPATVDERAIEDNLPLAGRDPVSVARHLALAKATNVSERSPGAFVIGCDQTMSLGNRIFHKAASLDEARQTLISLRGKAHFLNSAVCLVRDGELLWSDVTKACMQVRDFSDEFLDGYIERNGKSILSSVGCYQLEGEGVQLFDAIAGDYFTILGLPLLPLLAALREHEINHA
ncbi:septum formation inhibitor Maf [Rhizobium rosettiformans]|uniref:Nucleoside triphosphate pyrophosphatase n=1 Tax=Rhizobium rosettiformans TaxID=1368430 RepID=A0ABX7ERZ1_9HYPH|nr:Maf family protein [Rhizobium rosettiformans]QRF51028.1 septum formation inhibitor Maf [Rhizobium rosettiformans]